MILPLVPALSQFDGGPKASENCTCTSAARLMLYERGVRVTGSAVRAKQSDQSGGTSIPDCMRALHRGWSFEPPWAAPGDTNAGQDPLPVNRQGEWITEDRLWDLLRAGYMVLTQGDYGDLPLKYREQAGFTGDHAFTCDAVRDTPSLGREVYVVDTIPRYSEDYVGRWIPWHALMAYTRGLSGTGRVYAAWAKPLPDTSTGDEMYSLPEADGPYPATVDPGTDVFDAPEGGNRTQTLNDSDKPFTVVAASKGSTPGTGRRAIYGKHTGAAVRLGWVAVNRINSA